MSSGSASRLAIRYKCEEPPQFTWAGYQAEISVRDLQPKPIIAMLPLFRYKAHTPFTVVEAAVEHLNPGQTPVITFDQPLFALAKQIQWHHSERFGEDRFLVMVGGLHMEMAVLRLLGNWLDGSGWVYFLVQAKVQHPALQIPFYLAVMSRVLAMLT